MGRPASAVQSIAPDSWIRNPKLLWPLAAAATVCAGLSPAVAGRFGFGDDYTLLFLARTNPHDFISTYLGSGRPLGGLLSLPLYTLAGTIDHLGAIRALCVLSIASAAAILCATAGRFGFRWPLAFLAGASMAWLPATLVSGTWATQIVGALAVALSLFAGLVLTEAEFRPWRSFAVGTCIQCVAVCLYQPGAMPFWAVWLLWLWAPISRRAAVRDIARVTTAFLGAMAVCSAVALVTHRLGVSAMQVTSSRAAPVADLPERISTVIRVVWLRVADPWTDGHPQWAGAIAAVLGMAMLSFARLSITRRLAGLAAVFSVLFLAYAPNLATAEEWFPLRSMLGIALVLPVCALVAADAIADRLPVASRAFGVSLAALVAVLGTAWSASFVESEIVVPQERELALVRGIVPAFAGAPSLILLPSLMGESLAHRIDHDEIGIPSTSEKWVIVPLVELVHREQTGAWYGHARAQSRDDAPVPGSTVLDFAALLNPRSR